MQVTLELSITPKNAPTETLKRTVGAVSRKHALSKGLAILAKLARVRVLELEGELLSTEAKVVHVRPTTERENRSIA